MKELFAQLKKTKSNKLILLDTCFIIDLFSKHKEKELQALLEERDVALTSFNVEELIHTLPKLKHVKDRIRHFIAKKPKLLILDIPVHPGNIEQEKAYVEKIDPYLAQDIPDPSDAVLVAAAVQTKSIVMTKDKHHLFTSLLENYLTRWGLHVLKDLHELKKL